MRTRLDEIVGDGLATVGEASRFLRISRSRLYELMDDGLLAYAKIGRSRRIPWRALKELAAASLVQRDKEERVAQ